VWLAGSAVVSLMWSDGLERYQIFSREYKLLLAVEIMWMLVYMKVAKRETAKGYIYARRRPRSVKCTAHGVDVFVSGM
jgi:hypothetical protein